MAQERFFIAISNEIWRPVLYSVVRDFNPTTTQIITGTKGEKIQVVTFSLKQREAEKAASGTNLIPKGLRRIKFSFRGRIPLVERHKATVRINFVNENGWSDDETENAIPAYFSEEDQLETLKADLKIADKREFRRFSWIMEELFPCESATRIIEGIWETEQKSKIPALKNPIYAEALGHVAMCHRNTCQNFMRDYEEVFIPKAKEAFESFKI